MLKNTTCVILLCLRVFVCTFAQMKKIITLIFIVLLKSSVVVGQTAGTPTCNLSVTIDSIVVTPCFKVTGGSCGCSNTLWAIVNGGTAPYTYAWSTIDGAVAGTADTLHGACYEVWKVTVKDASGCIDSSKLNVQIPASTSGITIYNNVSALKLYPVPANNTLNVSLAAPSNNTHIEMFDMLGKKLIEQNIADGVSQTALDVSAYPAGNYFVRIIGNKAQQTVKFTINK